jgi:D-alanine-D-alanine ligase
MRPLQVVILYNEPVLPRNHPDADSEHEILETVATVAQTLVAAGHDVRRLGVGYDPRVLLEGLTSSEPDVVFNLFEGLASHSDTEAHVAGMLDWLGIPYTGSPFPTLCLARSKDLTKYLLLGAGLPTPAFFVVDKLPVPSCLLRWPVIVKPAQQDASIGLDQGSVVTGPELLEQRVAQLLRRYGPPVLVEEFIPGRELNVALIEGSELQMLPVSEVLFIDRDPEYWPIVTYDAKWKPGSRDYEATPPRYPAEVGPHLEERLETLARSAFRLLVCRDYARVDFRVRPDGEPYILEVNPNPDFSPSAGLAGGLRSAGLTHEQFTLDLVRNALARNRTIAAFAMESRAMPSQEPEALPS